jgi:hypothetical protein
MNSRDDILRFLDDVAAKEEASNKWAVATRTLANLFNIIITVLNLQAVWLFSSFYYYQKLLRSL